MAVTLEGFSIREYSSRMRSIDIAKCWPFDEKLKDEQQVEAFLPPITVRKFRWWSDEIQSSSSAQGEYTSSMNLEADYSCSRSHESLKREKRQMSSSKAKSRAPKKRSIVEIFAVAPQVERVDADDDYDYGDSDDDDDDIVHRDDLKRFSSLINVGLREKINEKKNQKKIKKKRKNCKAEREEETLSSLCKANKLRKKERDFTVNNPFTPSMAKKEKTHKNKLQSPGTFPRKPCGSSYIKGLTKGALNAPSHKKKQRLKQMAKEVKTKTVGTTKLTAKNKKAVFLVQGILKNYKKVVSGQNSTPCNLHGAVQSNRRVRFSGKDHILGLRRKSFPSVEFPTIQKDHSEERRLKLPNVVGNGIDENVSVTTVNEAEQPTINNYWLSNTLGVDQPKVLWPQSGCQEPFLPDCSTTVTNVAVNGEKLHLFESHEPPLYASAPRFLPTPNGAHMNLQVGGNSSKLINHSWYPSPRDSSECSMEHMMAFPQHSPPCFSNFSENVYARFPFPSQTTTNYCNSQASQSHPLFHQSHSLPYRKQRGVLFEEKYRDATFMGLPLNSQGEFIQFSSCGKGGFRQPIRPCGTGNHLYFKSSNENAQLDFFPAMDLMNISHQTHKQYEQVHNHQGNGIMNQQGNLDPLSIRFSEPTMRLMGKEFIVGRRNKDLQGSEDGNGWMEKQITGDQNRNRQFQQEYKIPPASGRERNTAACSSAFHIMNLSQSVPQMQLPHSGFSHPYLSCQSNAAYGNIHQPNFVSGYESPNHTSHDMSFSPVQCKNKQKLSNSIEESVFKFPFLRGELVQPSWLLNATSPQKEPIGSTWQSYPDTDSSYYHPCTMSGNNLQKTIHPICRTPEVSFQCNPMFIDSALPNFLSHVSSTCPPSTRAGTGFLPTSVINNGHEKRMKSKVGVKKLPHGKRNITRPAAKPDNSLKPTKITNLQIQEDSSSMIALKACGQNGSQMDAHGEIPDSTAVAAQGPIKLAAGAKHILKPSQDMDECDSRLTHSTIPFDAMTSSSRDLEPEKISATVYRF